MKLGVNQGEGDSQSFPSKSPEVIMEAAPIYNVLQAFSVRLYHFPISIKRFIRLTNAATLTDKVVNGGGRGLTFCQLRVFG